MWAIISPTFMKGNVMKVYDIELDENRHPTLITVEEKMCSKKQFISPKEIIDIFTLVFELHKKAEEYLYLAAFDTKQQLLGIFNVAKGTVKACLCSTRAIFLRALSVGAVGIVVVHNHPSGVSEPSKEDTLMAQKIYEAGRILDIELLDFIIIGNEEHYSMSENDNGVFDSE